jgi:hypothetical protein
MEKRSTATRVWMKRSPALYGWLAGFAVGAIFLVVAPMVDSLDKNYLIPAHWKLVFAAAGVVSIAGVFALERSGVIWPLMMTIGILCAYMIRVFLDGAHARSTHNLLPFELIIDFVDLMIVCLIGSGIGYLARRRADKESDQPQWAPSWKPPRSSSHQP